jgi:hypothetical protein
MLPSIIARAAINKTEQSDNRFHEKDSVLLVSNPFAGLEQFFPSLDHAYFSANLKRKGTSAFCIDISPSLSKGKLFSDFMSFCNSLQYRKLRSCIRGILDLIGEKDITAVVLPYYLSINAKNTTVFSTMIEQEIASEYHGLRFYRHGPYLRELGRSASDKLPPELDLVRKRHSSRFSLPPAEFVDFSLSDYQSRVVAIL